jgi:hypothetical protein
MPPTGAKWSAAQLSYPIVKDVDRAVTDWSTGTPDRREPTRQEYHTGPSAAGRESAAQHYVLNLNDAHHRPRVTAAMPLSRNSIPKSPKSKSPERYRHNKPQLLSPACPEERKASCRLFFVESPLANAAARRCQRAAKPNLQAFAIVSQATRSHNIPLSFRLTFAFFSPNFVPRTVRTAAPRCRLAH